jgi:hypothetical protein
MALLVVALAVPVGAANHDELINGDLGTDPLAPTALPLSVGSNVITGTTGNFGGVIDRDYVTFTVPAGHVLVAINLLAWAPDNLGFSSLNTGATSFVPSGATAASFLAGIHPAAGDVGGNLLDLMVSESVTGNSLPVPSLSAGTYCFLVQQTNPITQSYSMDFVLAGPISTQKSTWGGIKALYR